MLLTCQTFPRQQKTPCEAEGATLPHSDTLICQSHYPAGISTVPVRSGVAARSRSRFSHSLLMSAEILLGFDNFEYNTGPASCKTKTYAINPELLSRVFILVLGLVRQAQGLCRLVNRHSQARTGNQRSPGFWYSADPFPSAETVGKRQAEANEESRG